MNNSTSICPFESGNCENGGGKITKMEYLDNEKSFLGELKNIFHSLKGYHLVKKIKIIIKIVDTNFNSFIVTNLRPCVSNKPIVLVKVLTLNKSSFIDRMSFIIIKNNC